MEKSYYITSTKQITGKVFLVATANKERFLLKGIMAEIDGLRVEMDFFI